ncbi:LysM peptidoglycan-binding domain-containing protein [Ralstonia pseudosolanacearum]|uniref:LysM peptidoglycan-binding domain-containing protein n=1 Tax=Ralstonia pseudosolanacearum TaxID=1310165 RepID=UPI001E596621
MLVNTSVIHQPELSSIRQSVLDAAVQTGSTTSTTVRPNDTLSNIVAREYGYPDGTDYREVQSDVIDAIKQLNSLPSDKIIAGQKLTLPFFFRRPLSRGSTPQRAQILDLRGAEPSAARLTNDNSSSQLWSLGRVRATPTIPQATSSVQAVRAASTAILRLSDRQFFERRNLLQLFKGNIAFPPVTDDFTLEFQDATESQPSTSSALTTSVTELDAKIDPNQLNQALTHSGRLYLLDYFAAPGSQKCEHGDLVYDKAVQTLETIGAGALRDRIVRRNIDFYTDRDNNLKFIEDWIRRSFFGDIQSQYLEALKTLRDRVAPPKGASTQLAIPGLFLQAIYADILAKPDTLVISSSFTTNSITSAFPQELRLSRRVSLVAAVLNVNGAVLESTIYDYQEPLRTLRQLGDDLGAVLVGYKDGNGVPKGMYSQTGVGVTTIDFGTVVGTLDTCKGKADIGASFAAPTVAAKLLVARLIWPQQGTPGDAIAARRRLLMSGKVEDALLGKYRSAGTPTIQRLLRPEGSTVYSRDGKNEDAKRYVGKMYVSIKHDGPIGSVPIVFGDTPDTVGTSFSAIQVGPDRLYLFDPRTLMWQSYPGSAVNGICLCDDAVSRQSSFSDVLKTISEVTLYE